MLISGENEAEEDFRRFFSSGGHLIRCCVTKSKLIEYLNGAERAKSPPPDRSTHLRQLIKHWKEHLSQFTVLRIRTREISIDVDLQIAPRNILERSLFIHNEIGEGNTTNTSKNPEGWEYPGIN